MVHELICRTCETRYNPGTYPLGCSACRDEGQTSALEVELDYSDIDLCNLPISRAQTHEELSMWRYRELLPLIPETPITLGEGMTPLLELTDVSGTTDVTVFLKNETVNPTWSYKDRLNSLLISNVVALGRDHIATSSTGNHGASTAAYAQHASVEKTVVLLPHSVEGPCLNQIQAYGAKPVITESKARRKLLQQLVEDGWYPTVNVTNTHTGLPYAYEGYKTIAFELVDQLDAVPDAIFIAVGSGDGLYGIWKGFRELSDLGIIDTSPRMIALQPEEQAPLVKAIVEGDKEVTIDEDRTPITVSTMSLAVGSHAIQAIEESDGSALAMDRTAIKEAVRAIGNNGIFLEPASALTLAGVSEAFTQGLIDSADTIVCIGTGAGVKWPDSAEKILDPVTEIAPNYESLVEVVETL